MSGRLNGQVLFAIALIVLNTIYASQIVKLGMPFATGEPGPAFLPILLSGLLYLMMGGILVGELRKARAGTGDMLQSDTVPSIGFVGPLLMMALTIMFIIGFYYTGYLASAAAYTFLIALYFNYEQGSGWTRALTVSAATAIAVTVFGWLFFVKLFDLYLPLWEF